RSDRDWSSDVCSSDLRGVHCLCLVFAFAFEGKETKELVLLKCAPQRSPKLLACVVGMRLSCGARAAGILLIRVQIGGAEIAEERAVKEVRARLGNHIDRRALRASIHG